MNSLRKAIHNTLPLSEKRRILSQMTNHLKNWHQDRERTRRIVANPLFQALDNETVETFFLQTLTEKCNSLAEQIFRSKKFEQFSPRCLGRALTIICKRRNEDYLRRILRHSKFSEIPKNILLFARSIASKENMVNAIERKFEECAQDDSLKNRAIPRTLSSLNRYSSRPRTAPYCHR